VLPGDAEDPRFPAGSFDAVLASNVMFLLPDPGAAAARYLELLRPGGTFAFSWNLAEDPAWVPVLAAVDARAADGGFSAFLHRPPFDSIPAMAEMLRQRGYPQVMTRQEISPVRYASPDAWWQVSWDQAPALFWDGIPEAELRAARTEATSILDGMRAPDGGLHRRLTFCCARAVRAGRAVQAPEAAQVYEAAQARETAQAPETARMARLWRPRPRQPSSASSRVSGSRS
jgi:SAM-dependent methyltransferase